MSFERERRRRGARRDAELAEDVLQMACDCVLADHELGGDLPVGPTGRHQPEDLELAGTEPVVLCRPAREARRFYRRALSREEVVQVMNGGEVR